MTNVLTDEEIRAIQAQHPTDNDPMQFARAIESALLAKLAAGVSVEPAAWMRPSVTENGCVYDSTFRDENGMVRPETRVEQGFESLYTVEAIASAHALGRKSVHDSCVDVWKGEFLAAARVAAINECADLITPPEAIKRINGQAYRSATRLANGIRALIGKEST